MSESTSIETERKKPKCRLSSGVDGNVFVVIGTICKALKRGGEAERADQFREAAFKAHSYDEVLALAFDYVDVE